MFNFLINIIIFSIMLIIYIFMSSKNNMGDRTIDDADWGFSCSLMFGIAANFIISLFLGVY